MFQGLECPYNMLQTWETLQVLSTYHYQWNLTEVSCFNTTFLHSTHLKRGVRGVKPEKNNSDSKVKFICSLKKHRWPASCKGGRSTSPDCLSTHSDSLVSLTKVCANHNSHHFGLFKETNKSCEILKPFYWRVLLFCDVKTSKIDNTGSELPRKTK